MSRGVKCLFSKIKEFLAVQIPHTIHGNKAVLIPNGGRLEAIVEPKKASLKEPNCVGSKLDAQICDDQICLVKVQCRNRWSAVSGSPHCRHVMLLVMPRLAKLSPRAIAPCVIF